jgi:hypothetical protein
VKLIEHSPDGYDGSDGFGKAFTTLEENHNVEITNKEENMPDISEQNLNNDVNNTMEKNEDATNVPAKPSDPSDPSVSLGNKGMDEAINKPEGSYSTKASTTSPQFECHFKGCGQRFNNQSELIGHMDKESAEARQRTEKV